MNGMLLRAAGPLLRLATPAQAWASALPSVSSRQYSSDKSDEGDASSSAAGGSAWPSDAQGATPVAGTRQWREWADGQLNAMNEEAGTDPAAAAAARAFASSIRDAAVDAGEKLASDSDSDSEAGPPSTPAHPKFGLLAKATDAAGRTFGMDADRISPVRVHPHHLFFPGQTYTADDLNAYEAPLKGLPSAPRAPPSSSDVKQRADFRNPFFLSHFVTESGQLVSRRRTRLSKSAHVAAGRQVKIARAMGFLSHDTGRDVLRERAKSHKVDLKEWW